MRIDTIKNVDQRGQARLPDLEIIEVERYLLGEVLSKLQGLQVQTDRAADTISQVMKAVLPSLRSGFSQAV